MTGIKFKQAACKFNKIQINNSRLNMSKRMKTNNFWDVRRFFSVPNNYLEMIIIQQLYG